MLLSAGFCLKVRMALCCTQGISGLQKEKQPEWSFCIQGPGELYLWDIKRTEDHMAWAIWLGIHYFFHIF